MTMTNKNETKRLLLRQGDVMIERVDFIPADTTEVKRSKRGVVLAEGEVTGHAHRIPSRSATLYRSETDQRFMKVGGSRPVALNHEEHTTVNIPPGNYRVHIHAEYQPGELPRTVVD
jgi:hypothetical protein